MNKELQDKAWSVLPKEFKEEVKKLYREFTFTREGYYVELFGLHNLTSDAEGEEILMVPRKDVMNHFSEACLDRIYYSKDSKDYAQAIGRKIILVRLFGKDKCLPDDKADYKADGNENSSDVDGLSHNQPENCDKANRISTDGNNPSKPRFKVGDKVVVISSDWRGRTGIIQDIDEDNRCLLDSPEGVWFAEYNLRPYAKPEAKEEKNNQTFDRILAMNTEAERRQIAAIIMASMMQNAKWGDKYTHIASMAVSAADALIAELNKRKEEI